jgi:hypothetical protein
MEFWEILKTRHGKGRSITVPKINKSLIKKGNSLKLSVLLHQEPFLLLSEDLFFSHSLFII